MNLLFKSPVSRPGFYSIIERGNQLKHLSFSVLELGDSFLSHSFDTGEEEKSLDFYTGPVEVTVEWAKGREVYNIPDRLNLDAAHPMLYLPSGARVTLKALAGPARISIGGALGKPDASPVLISGDAIASRHIGKDNWTRTVHTHIAENVDAAHLICGETVNRPGGWSSCPPHKHDEYGAAEVPMEEIYYFQISPQQGFGFQRVYTSKDSAEPFDLSFAVEHGDTLAIPRGYHPVAACPGYTVNYTWILAGDGRQYGAWSDDPAHAWLRNS